MNGNEFLFSKVYFYQFKITQQANKKSIKIVHQPSDLFTEYVEASFYFKNTKQSHNPSPILCIMKHFGYFLQLLNNKLHTFCLSEISLSIRVYWYLEKSICSFFLYY